MAKKKKTKQGDRLSWTGIKNNFKKYIKSPKVQD